MKDIRWLKQVLRNYSIRLNQRYANRRYETLGEEFITDDWDVLVLLDACRPDLLFDCDLPTGKLTTRYSAGGESWEFMEANFSGRELHDTVYITSNPHAYNLLAGTFHYIHNLLEEAWDDELGTVPPNAVTEVARRAVECFPQKRLIVHYMQPHYPFIGETGQEIDQSAISPGEPGTNSQGGANPWTRLQNCDGNLSRDTVLKAYKENHEIIAAELFDLVEATRGKVVITADHANLTGERGWPLPVRLYGHPAGFKHPALRRVPWIEIDNGARPEIEAEDSIGEQQERDISDTEVKDQLRALGYA